MPDVHDEPCLVEAHQGEVLVECGANMFSLTPDAALDLGRRLVEQAEAARGQTGTDDEP